VCCGWGGVGGGVGGGGMNVEGVVGGWGGGGGVLLWGGGGAWVFWVGRIFGVVWAFKIWGLSAPTQNTLRRHATSQTDLLLRVDSRTEGSGIGYGLHPLLIRRAGRGANGVAGVVSFLWSSTRARKNEKKASKKISSKGSRPTIG